MYIYEILNKQLRSFIQKSYNEFYFRKQQNKDDLSVAYLGITSQIAKLVACTLTYPFSTIRAKWQVDPFI